MAVLAVSSGEEGHDHGIFCSRFHCQATDFVCIKKTIMAGMSVRLQSSV